MPGRPTILLVEDEETIRSLVEQALDLQGYDVRSAADAVRAREIAGSHAGPIALLVTDVALPGIRGPELAQGLRELHPEMKVLYISGYSEGVLEEEGEDPDRGSFLQKPFSLSALEERVRELLEESP